MVSEAGDEEMRTRFTTEVCEADDEMVSSTLLEWSGLQEEWNAKSLNNLFDFAAEIALKCRHIKYKTKEWSNLPGHGGVWFTFFTDDEDALKEEMRDRFMTLLETNAIAIKRNVAEAKKAARELQKRINAGPIMMLRTFPDHVELFYETIKPAAQYLLGVSTEDWADIQQGQRIRYKDIFCTYEGLRFSTTWEFNIPSEGSVRILESGGNPRFSGAISDFSS